jgi:A nuclease family of the HNH/ENDO VII superfamily with conserved AHH
MSAAAGQVGGTALAGKTPGQKPEEQAETKPAEAAGKTLSSRDLSDAELQALLDQTPNWQKIQDWVGRRLPDPGTPEFAAIKQDLEAAGYQLEVLKGGPQPCRLRRIGERTEQAPLTVTPEGIVVLKVGGSSRMSVPARARGNFLTEVERTQGKAAAVAAEARLGEGHQIHHLIPDAVAREHEVVQEAMRRVQGYSIDRAGNLIDMPNSIGQAKGRIIHRGSHPQYDQFVTERLDSIRDDLTVRSGRSLEQISPHELDQVLRQLERELRRRMKTGDFPSRVLKELRQHDDLIGHKLSETERPKSNESIG